VRAAGRHRDIALALIVSRILRPGSKLSTLAWWDDVMLGPSSASSAQRRRGRRHAGLAAGPGRTRSSGSSRPGASPRTGSGLAITAENAAEQCGVTRAGQDALPAGYFAGQIIPVQEPGRKGHGDRRGGRAHQDPA
jgi:hypothetical protein